MLRQPSSRLQNKKVVRRNEEFIRVRILRHGVERFEMFELIPFQGGDQFICLHRAKVDGSFWILTRDPERPGPV